MGDSVAACSSITGPHVPCEQCLPLLPGQRLVASPVPITSSYSPRAGAPSPARRWPWVRSIRPSWTLSVRDRAPVAARPSEPGHHGIITLMTVVLTLTTSVMVIAGAHTEGYRHTPLNNRSVERQHACRRSSRARPTLARVRQWDRGRVWQGDNRRGARRPHRVRLASTARPLPGLPGRR